MIQYPIILLCLFVISSVAQDLDLQMKSHPHFSDTSTQKKFLDLKSDFTPAESVNDLEKQEHWIRTQLTRFPVPESKSSPPQQHLGFLCLMTKDVEKNKKSQWIELTLNKSDDINIEGIALVPALYHKLSTTASHGFPKRFKIELYSIQDPEKPITIVDWTNKDFPNPGLSPVLFSTEKLRVNRLKLIVTEGVSTGDNDFFALDELMVFRDGNNIAPPIVDQLKVSNSLKAPPYWDKKYLVDGVTHFGQPLGGSQKMADLIQYYKNNVPSQKKLRPSVTIDLGKSYSIGRVELYAANNTHSHIPSIPLPQEYTIELLSDLGPNGVVESHLRTGSNLDMVRLHPLFSSRGRYIRLHFEKLPLHRNVQVLSIAEIKIVGDEAESQKPIDRDKRISSSDLFKEENNANLLIDGFASGQLILSEKTHVEQLAKRAIVENSYKKIVEKLKIAKALQTQRETTVYIISAIIVFILFSLLLLHFRNQKKKEILSLQKQIAADLHDDISANLGTISMISNRLFKRSEDELSQKKLKEINHLSQESYISVKEIIWHTDSVITNLSELLNQIKRTARSILSDCTLKCDFPSQYTDREVSVVMKRNIILLVKETLYNSTKYAKASHMFIQATITDSTLTLIMRDDGCGFDDSNHTSVESNSGRGLVNMEQRAKLLGANLTINSILTKGTEIKLKMPLY